MIMWKKPSQIWASANAGEDQKKKKKKKGVRVQVQVQADDYKCLLSHDRS